MKGIEVGSSYCPGGCCSLLLQGKAPRHLLPPIPTPAQDPLKGVGTGCPGLPGSGTSSSIWDLRIFKACLPWAPPPLMLRE